MKKFLYEYRGYLGDIFNNDFKITSKVTNTKMDHISNSALKATMEANIGIKTAAAVPLGRVLDMATVKIYQSFLLTLKTSYRVKNGNDSTLITNNGFAENSNPRVTVSSFLIGGESVDTMHDNDNSISTCELMSGNHARIDANYLELRSNADLSKLLLEQYTKFDKHTADTSKIQIISEVELKYATSEQIELQFPEYSVVQGQVQDVGTSMEGYSNISTQPETAVYSKTSKFDADGNVDPAEPTRMYYRDSIKHASF